MFHSDSPLSALISNLPAPTGERATRNESSQGAFGIPEYTPPVGSRLSQWHIHGKNLPKMV